MKYPKPWDAGGKWFVSSLREGPNAGKIRLSSYVQRLGTPDHQREIRMWLTLADAEALRAHLSHHIELIHRRETGLVERMTDSGEIGTGPYHSTETR